MSIISAAIFNLPLRALTVTISTAVSSATRFIFELLLLLLLGVVVVEDETDVMG